MTKPTRNAAERKAERGIRVGILAVLLTGLRRRNPGAVLNGILLLAATYLPEFVERRYDVEFRPWQRVYVESAMVTHAAGMLGLYDDIWWWDHLTHTHSSTLLSGLVYTVSRRRDRDPRPRVVAIVVLVGVVWEFTEYVIHAVADRLGLEPILVHYGRTDTLLDLVFDLAGALLVLAFGDRPVGNFVGDAATGLRKEPEDTEKVGLPGTTPRRAARTYIHRRVPRTTGRRTPVRSRRGRREQCEGYSFPKCIGRAT